MLCCDFCSGSPGSVCAAAVHNSCPHVAPRRGSNPSVVMCRLLGYDLAKPHDGSASGKSSRRRCVQSAGNVSDTGSPARRRPYRGLNPPPRPPLVAPALAPRRRRRGHSRLLSRRSTFPIISPRLAHPRPRLVLRLARVVIGSRTLRPLVPPRRARPALPPLVVHPSLVPRSTLLQALVRPTPPV